MFKLQRRDTTLGVLIMSAGTDISYVESGYESDDRMNVTHKNKIKERELVSSDNDCVKHPITLDKVVRRIEFYEQAKSGQDQFMAEQNIGAIDDPYAWHISVDLVRSNLPMHNRHSSDYYDNRFDSSRRTMLLYRDLDKTSNSRLSTSLRR